MTGVMYNSAICVIQGMHNKNTDHFLSQKNFRQKIFLNSSLHHQSTTCKMLLEVTGETKWIFKPQTCAQLLR